MKSSTGRDRVVRDVVLKPVALTRASQAKGLFCALFFFSHGNKELEAIYYSNSAEIELTKDFLSNFTCWLLMSRERKF